jgi:acyl dehydratase
MPVDPERLLALEFPEIECVWSERECLLYAVATGFGQNPLDERELPYVCETAGLIASPTALLTFYYDDRWMRASGVNLEMSVHGEQRIVWHRTVPTAGRARVASRITGLFDKGLGKGLVVVCEQTLRDVLTEEAIATVFISNFARADGGIGFSSGAAPRPHALPERPADIVIERPTRPEQALIYRLCGDRNPLHADPHVAQRAGFSRPILHGMCTFGFASRAVLEGACGYDPRRLRSFGARMSAPVYPGDVLRTEIWRDADVVSFRTTAPNRDHQVVLNNGRAELG